MADLLISQRPFLRSVKLDYAGLMSYRRVGLRRGNWGRLETVEKALYRCGLWVAKVRGRITCTKLSVSILSIITKLVATARASIYSLGLARARTLWSNYVSAGVCQWAPEVNALLSRVDYVMYLGVMELSG